jgi:hypothetical protein
VRVVKVNIARKEFTDMVNSVVDRSEQRQLAALFVELDEVLHEDSKVAGLVTFWRHQLHAGIEPSHLPELLEVLDALTDSRMADGDLHRSVRHWQVILQSRASRDGEPAGDRGHPDLL